MADGRGAIPEKYSGSGYLCIQQTCGTGGWIPCYHETQVHDAATTVGTISSSPAVREEANSKLLPTLTSSIHEWCQASSSVLSVGACAESQQRSGKENVVIEPRFMRGVKSLMFVPPGSWQYFSTSLSNIAVREG